MKRRISHLYFDFFGTLVAYSPSRTEQGYSQTHRLLRDLGGSLDYAAFLGLWSGVSEAFEAEAERTLREYSMHAVTGAFLERALGRRPPEDDVAAFADCYIEEWNQGVHDLPGLPALLDRLSYRYALGLITNTHDPSLVLGHLERIGIRDRFDVVVTSIEHGFRKPHPAIFGAALDALAAEAEASVYVGDSHEADYTGADGAGLRPLLIDPAARANVAATARLRSLFELESWLEAHSSPRSSGIE